MMAGGVFGFFHTAEKPFFEPALLLLFHSQNKEEPNRISDSVWFDFDFDRRPFNHRANSRFSKVIQTNIFEYRFKWRTGQVIEK
jgi:hypothetical protein